MAKGQIIQSVDVEDVIKFIINKNKRIQAIFLTELETIIEKDSVEYGKIRKLYLDLSNGYRRSVLTSLFGDIEDG